MKKITPKKQSSSAFCLLLISSLTATLSATGIVQAQTSDVGASVSNSSAAQFLNSVNVINANPGNTTPQIQNLTNTLQLTAPLPQNIPNSGVTLRNDTVIFTGVGAGTRGTNGTSINTPLNQNIPLPNPGTSASGSIGNINTGGNNSQGAIAITPQQVQNLTNALLLTSPLPQAISGSGVTLQSKNVVFNGVRGGVVESSTDPNELPANTNTSTATTTTTTTTTTEPTTEVQSTASDTAPPQAAEDRSTRESASLPIPSSTGSVEARVPLIPFLQGGASAVSVPLMAQSLIEPTNPTIASTVKLGSMTVALSEQLAGSVQGLLASDTVNVDRLNTAFSSYNNLIREMGLTSKNQLADFPQLRKVGFVLASLRNLAGRG